MWLRHGLLRAQPAPDRQGWARIGLLATSALLLGGDEVVVEVDLGPGACLDLYDVAGTLAYHGRGQPAGWALTVSIAAGASLRYRGAPFVVADGADVIRTTHLDLAADARLWLRETIVLGRTGQVGGRVRTHTRLRLDDRDIWLEDQDLDPRRGRRRPGLLGENRILDPILTVGLPAPSAEGALPYHLVGEVGTLTRYLGTDLARSPFHA